jgi:hypothetical protein
MTEPGKKNGCFFYGLITAVALAVIFLASAMLGYRYAKQTIAQFSDAKPAPLAAPQLTEPEIADLRGRIAAFGELLNSTKPAEPLALTSDEVNALIAIEPDLKSFRGKWRVNFTNDRFNAKISIPAEELEMEHLQGRYINASGAFTIVLKDGALYVNPISLVTSKDKPLPAAVMRKFQLENFAAQLNSVTNLRKAFIRLQSIEVKNGKLLIVPKKVR